MAGQNPVLLSPQMPLVDAGRRMERSWYAFFAERLRRVVTTITVNEANKLVITLADGTVIVVGTVESVTPP